MLNENKYEMPFAKNKQTATEIPNDEPVFLFRARDNKAMSAIRFYSTLIDNAEHKAAVEYVLSKFDVWRYENKNLTKEPD